jgi:hypothetical protein
MRVKGNARGRQTLHWKRHTDTSRDPRARRKAHLILVDGERLLPKHQPLLPPDPTSERILLEANGTLTDDT